MGGGIGVDVIRKEDRLSKLLKAVFRKVLGINRNGVGQLAWNKIK